MSKQADRLAVERYYQELSTFSNPGRISTLSVCVLRGMSGGRLKRIRRDLERLVPVSEFGRFVEKFTERQL